MRGVLQANTTDATVVDITHDLPRQDISTAAFWLRELLPWFPPAVHCAVIDPGVGTDRDALVVSAGDHLLVGPDNGVLAPAARELGDPDWYRVTDIDPESSTFHGRDVFAPVAARVHETDSESIESLEGLEPAPDPVTFAFPEPTQLADGIEGVALVIDGFGNVITNIPGKAIIDTMGESLSINGVSVPVRRAYGAADPGTKIVTIGSHENVELAVNQGRGDEAFELSVGDIVRITGLH